MDYAEKLWGTVPFPFGEDYETCPLIRQAVKDTKVACDKALERLSDNDSRFPYYAAQSDAIFSAEPEVKK